MCGTGWVEGQPCDDCEALTKPSCHHLQGRKKKKKGFFPFVPRHVQVLASLQAHDRRPILFMLQKIWNLTLLLGTQS